LTSATVTNGVRRVVFASSNHATGGYELNRRWPPGADQPTWPDSPYGVTKAFGKQLGRYYFDRHGLSVICLRIGSVVPRLTSEVGLRMWLSPGDTCRLIDARLSASVRLRHLLRRLGEHSL
jgi:NAD+ dependent glucose-6-phosphate dehydrogenase